MNFSIPFLASRPAQFDTDWSAQGFGAEATLLDRIDVVDDAQWASVGATVREIAALDVLPQPFTLHFPVNDSDYVDDALVRNRLLEAYDLVADAGLQGIVVHSNRIRRVEQWQKLDVRREREMWLEAMTTLTSEVADAPFWVAVENMPAMGNEPTELDPLFVYADDFAGIAQANVGVCWDVCHYAYTCYVSDLLLSGRLDEWELYPEVRAASLDNVEAIGDAILHVHFGAFEGIAARSAGTICREGVLPSAGTLEEGFYVDAVRLAARLAHQPAMVLELTEEDYTRRRVAFEAAAWCRSVLPERELERQ